MFSGKRNSDRGRTRRTKTLFWCTGCIALASSTLVQAASWTWIGAGGSTATPNSGNWNVANNWSPNTGSPPGNSAANALEFRGTGITGYTSTSTANIALGTITLNSSASALETINGTTAAI